MAPRSRTVEVLGLLPPEAEHKPATRQAVVLGRRDKTGGAGFDAVLETERAELVALGEMRDAPAAATR